MIPSQIVGEVTYASSYKVGENSIQHLASQVIVPPVYSAPKRFDVSAHDVIVPFDVGVCPSWDRTFLSLTNC